MVAVALVLVWVALSIPAALFAGLMMRATRSVQVAPVRCSVAATGHERRPAVRVD